MNIQITEEYVVKTSDYNTVKFAVTVGMSHLDLGITDEQLVQMSEKEQTQCLEDLKNWVNSELWGEVKTRLMNADKVSESDDNLAAKILKLKMPPRSQNAKANP